LVNSPADEREAVLLGGLFAYDLVAGFETRFRQIKTVVRAALLILQRRQGFEARHQIVSKQAAELTFPQSSGPQDEDSRLQALSVFDALRLIPQLVKPRPAAAAARGHFLTAPEWSPDYPAR
jgi:hypothetical protein